MFDKLSSGSFLSAVTHYITKAHCYIIFKPLTPCGKEICMMPMAYKEHQTMAPDQTQDFLHRNGEIYVWNFNIHAVA